MVTRATAAATINCGAPQAASGFRGRSAPPRCRSLPPRFQGARAIDEASRELGPGLPLPRHEPEMTREGGRNRRGALFAGGGGRALAQRESLVLLWGEHFPATRADLPARP